MQKLQYQRNLIKGMCDASGVWQEDDQWVENFVDYFASIYKTNGPTDTSALVGAIQPVVCEAMNFSLIQDF